MNKSRLAGSIACVIFAAASCLYAQENGLAPAPPMGWSTWNHFHHDISDALIRAQADAMVASGMRDAGYVYINIDGGWEGERDTAGVLHPNTNFPDMKALGDYIHSKGLKFGIYSGPGPRTCGGAEASYGHEAQDARMFASWGVDFLKYDLCTFREIMAQQSGANVNDPANSGKAAPYSDIMAQEPQDVVKKGGRAHGFRIPEDASESSGHRSPHPFQPLPVWICKSLGVGPASGRQHVANQW